VLRCYSNNYGAVQRVERLNGHLAKRSVLEPPVTPRPTHRPTKLSQRLPDETVAAIVDAYKAGATTREVGQRFGLAHSSVNKLLKQHGVTARRRSPSLEEVQRAVELYEGGLSTRVVAEHLGYGANTILRALVRAGIAIRPRFGG
jgi:transposase-like protein